MLVINHVLIWLQKPFVLPLMSFGMQLGVLVLVFTFANLLGYFMLS